MEYTKYFADEYKDIIRNIKEQNDIDNVRPMHMFKSIINFEVGNEIRYMLFDSVPQYKLDSNGNIQMVGWTTSNPNKPKIPSLMYRMIDDIRYYEKATNAPRRDRLLFRLYLFRYLNGKCDGKELL